MQDLGIDLRLAVNYLPACSCALQSALLSLALCAVHSVRLLPAFVPACMALVLHRAGPRTLRIFDGSGVLFSIFLAHCVAALQEFGGGAWWTLWPPVHLALSLEWPALAGYFLYRPPAHRSRLRLALVAACCHASACAFLHRAEGAEHRLVRVGRDLAFCGLCLGWTYVVGIYRRRLSRDPSESSSHYAAYFWPVLYVHPYAAGAYALACAVAVGSQLRPADPASPRCCADSCADSGLRAEPDPPVHKRADEEAPAEGREDPAPPAQPGTDADDEALFRQALSATGLGGAGRCGM